MKIPKFFQLGGTIWKVELVDQLVGAYGTTTPQDTTVRLLKSLNKQVKEQTLCHELVHCILYSMGKPTHDHDEVFVDGFATFLHQYLNSVK
jgi:hypothetical protein